MSVAPRAARAPWLAALAVWSGATLGCGEDATGLACPLLAPGALALHPDGAALGRDASLSGTAAAGALVAHPIWLAPGEVVELTARATSPGRSVSLLAYGPRTPFGGLPHCQALRTGASARVTLRGGEQGGEHLVLVGPLPGEDALGYTLESRCDEGCEDGPRCATLAEQGCPDARCDGELARDAEGCLTCTCAPGALCGPDRAAGPSGSCVLPACDCAGAPAEPVCGADGATWPSPCAAACAGVPIAREGPCAIACPTLASCEAPCFGLRTLGPDGCPTCACMPTFAPDAASCRACPLERAPVCGSDGVTYPNACRARCAGAKILYAAACRDTCRSAPPGCTLDCAFGLRPVEGAGHCLACACATEPTTCATSGAPVCAPLPGPIGETTIGSGCAALALGSSGEGALWGPCGVRCEDDAGCPLGTRCRETGYLAGRCLLDAPECGCAALVEPVCGVDGATWHNACLARCAGVEVLHDGACCEPAPTCDSALLVDTRGCPATCGEAAPADCAANAATANACLPDGAPTEGSACAAHARGEPAFPEACP